MSRDTIFFCSKDARLPVQLQRAMAAEAEAAREARAKACCCVATPDTEHHSTYMLSFFLPLSFRLLLQRANKKPRELSKRPRRSFPSRHLPSSSVTCRYDIRLPSSPPRSDGRQARLVCRIGRMKASKGLFINDVIHV